MHLLFTVLIVLQFLVIVTHDWVHVPGWAHGRQVQAVVGRTKLFWATVIGAIFPALAVVSAICFLKRPEPAYVADYWIAYCGVTLISAIAMWYVPYLVG